MLSIVYASRASSGFSDADLADLLAQSRRNNERAGLTGLLMFRAGRFLQVLEGPDAAVRERMAVISADARHTAVAILIDEPIDERLFPEWSMGYRAVDAEAATGISGYRATFDDLDDERVDSESLPAIRELIRWFRTDAR